MAKAPKAAPVANQADAVVVEVLLPIDVDGVRCAPGDVTEIRAELVEALVAAGAVALQDAPAE